MNKKRGFEEGKNRRKTRSNSKPNKAETICKRKISEYDLPTHIDGDKPYDDDDSDCCYYYYYCCCCCCYFTDKDVYMICKECGRHSELWY
jgi:hypothetical protein